MVFINAVDHMFHSIFTSSRFTKPSLLSASSVSYLYNHIGNFTITNYIHYTFGKIGIDAALILRK